MGIALIIASFLNVAVAGIFGADNRVEVTNTTYPWTALGRLQIETSICTGVMVGPCQLLTAGHCVISEGTQKPYTYPMTFSPFGGNQTAKPVHMYWGTPQSHMLHEPNDWAILILDQSIGKKTGWFGVQNPSDFSLAVNPVILAGYNRDLFNGAKLTSDSTAVMHQFYSNGIIGLEADSFSGASGAPIWFMNASKQPTVVGIHVGAMMNVVNGKNTQMYFDQWSDEQKADAVAVKQFWSSLQEALQYQCPQ